MSAPVFLNTPFGLVWLILKGDKLTVKTPPAGAPARINSIACSLNLIYRVSGKSLRPMTMEAFTHPKHEMIPGNLAQKASQLMLPVAIQWLAGQTVPAHLGG